jgi:hypothetical protein
MLESNQKPEYRNQKRIRGWLCVGLAMVLVLGLTGAGAGYAKEKYEPKIINIDTKEIVGEIISFSPMRNPKYIGVAYNDRGAGYDAFFEVDENVKIAHKKNLDNIKLGDTVSVVYEEVTQVLENGRQQIKRIAKVIKFVKPAMRKLRPEPGETREPQEEWEIKDYKSWEVER